VKALDFTNKWVLITGASSGLGYEMAYQLAHHHKANLIIAARREDKLNQLKVELEGHAGIEVKVIVADLSSPTDIDRLVDESINGQELYCAILNAGITYFGKHAALSQNEFDTLMQTNVKSVVHITSELVKHFEETEKEAGIMVVSSMAALFPTPYQAVYSGTKSFVMNFINALALEVKNPKLSLTVFVPGGIVTEMTAGEKFTDLKKWLMPVNQAAKEGIYALKSRKFNHIPGTLNKLGSRFMRLFPRRFIMKQLGKRYLKSLLKLKADNK
jgi:short-subunit dehydrogenase